MSNNRANRRHPKQAAPRQSPASEEIVYGSEQWKAADAVVNDYQSTIESIRTGRKEASFKLSDRWDGWYNNLMVICFGLGGALIAVSTTLHFELLANAVLFWVGDCLLIANGLYILLLRKLRFEKDSTQAIPFGYKIEYYSMVARNRIQDILKNKVFQESEYEDAKANILEVALGDLDKSYEETKKIDIHMDIMTVAFIVSFELLVMSAINNSKWLIVSGVIGLIITSVLIIIFKRSAKEPKDAIAERDSWLEKIKSERTRS